MPYRFVWCVVMFAIGFVVQPALAQVEHKLVEARAIHELPPMRFEMLLSFVTGTLFTVCAFSAIRPTQILVRSLVCGLCYLATILDLKYRIIPNEIILGLLASGVISLLFGVQQISFGSALGGFGVCFALFLLPFTIGRKVGGGDVKLAAAIGFCVGFHGALTVTVIMGTMILLYTLLAKGTFFEAIKSMIPMAPFVTVAFLVFILL